MYIAFFHDISYSAFMDKSRWLLVIGALTVVNLVLFWKYSFIATIIFLILTFVQYKIFPIKHEFLIWFFLLLGGGIIEIFFVNYLHAWTYARPDFFGIPLYMPFLWSFLGTLLIAIYLEKNKIKN